MATNKRIPITRNNKFYSESDYLLDVSMSREFIEGDGNFTVILYQVDRGLSETDSLYGETSKQNIRFKTPVELKVMPIIEAPENKVYNKNSGSLRYLQDGMLKFSVFEAQLDELEVDLNFGDYIGYAVSETEIRYFSVVNNGSKAFDNQHTMFGYKGYYRSVICAPVTDDEFLAI